MDFGMNFSMKKKRCQIDARQNSVDNKHWKKYFMKKCVSFVFLFFSPFSA